MTMITGEIEMKIYSDDNPFASGAELEEALERATYAVGQIPLNEFEYFRIATRNWLQQLDIETGE